MICLPIASYFFTVDRVFHGMSSLETTQRPGSAVHLTYLGLPGNSTYAASLAAIVANVVVIGYVFLAMAEDRSDQLEASAKEKAKEGKKDQ